MNLEEENDSLKRKLEAAIAAQEFSHANLMILERDRQKAWDENEYLQYFYKQADFGPAHEDVVDIINEGYDKEIPENYRMDE